MKMNSVQRVKREMVRVVKGVETGCCGKGPARGEGDEKGKRYRGGKGWSVGEDKDGGGLFLGNHFLHTLGHLTSGNT